MAGEFTHLLLATLIVSVLLLAMGNMTGGFISAYSATSLNTSNESAHDLAYLQQAEQVEVITKDLQAKLEASNSSAQSGLLGSLGLVSSLGIDAAKLAFQAPALFLGIFGGAAVELGRIIPGSSVYISPVLLIPLILVGTAFLAWLFGRGEI